jgi:hypothetical protein
VLHIVQEPAWVSSTASGTEQRLFFDKLSTLKPTASLSSLHTLIFERMVPPTRFNGGAYSRYLLNLESYDERDSEDDPSEIPSTATILSQIKHLDFQRSNNASFDDVLYTIRLCTSVETVTAHMWDCEEVFPGIIHLLPPPAKTIQKLNISVSPFREMVKWFLSCKPRHVEISSLSVRYEGEYQGGVHWFFELNDVCEFLNAIGDNLEEMNLNLNGRTYELTEMRG